MTGTIASPRNPLLKDIRKALLRGTLTSDGSAIAESFHLLEEALRSGCDVPVVIAAESVKGTVQQHIRNLKDVRMVVLSDDLFEELSSTETSQGVIAMVRPPRWTLEQLLRGETLLVILDGVQDPGNAGTIVRTAEAFGATGVLFLKGSVSPYNAKALRAASGSMFRVPVVHGLEPDLVMAAFAQRRLELYAAMPSPLAKPIQSVCFTERCAVIIGSEGRGVSEKLRQKSTDIFVPTVTVESLNAAIAAGVILYEANRQRRISAKV